MKLCPKCHNFSVEYDSYRKADVCMIDGCSCVIISSNSYSYIISDPISKTINRVKVEEGQEAETIKQYNMI